MNCGGVSACWPLWRVGRTEYRRSPVLQILYLRHRCWENVAQQLFVFFLSQHPIIFAVGLLQGLSCLNDDAATLWSSCVSYIIDFHKHRVGVAALHVVVK